MEKTTLINDVSDTALWVAYYRAKETDRKDALFRDPFAKILIGERGKKIAEDMKASSHFTEWTVIMRTVVIDKLITEAIDNGIDTVLNLGAGMDTRPYRMKLPENLKWIEADQANIIALKEKILENEKPACHLSRVSVDLSDGKQRREFLRDATNSAGNVLVLTEGLIVYLTEEQVAAIAADLKDIPANVRWITEYLSPQVYPHLKTRERQSKFRNAPFQFFPADWIGFFNKAGWKQQKISYMGEMGISVNRPAPTPKLPFIVKLIAGKKIRENMKKVSGFMLLEKIAAE